MRSEKEIHELLGEHESVHDQLIAGLSEVETSLAQADSDLEHLSNLLEKTSVTTQNPLFVTGLFEVGMVRTSIRILQDHLLKQMIEEAKSLKGGE